MRCSWCKGDELYIKYHDEQWGVPCFDRSTLFEFLVLESAQAGLSWITILRKRQNYKEAYKNFDVEKVAKFSQKDVENLLENQGIVRNRKKIESSINNAQKFLEIEKEFGSFSSYIWAFVDNKPIINNWKNENEIPAQTELSDKIAKDLKRRGFRFLGSTTIYSYLQAVGLVDDHVQSCFKSAYSGKITV